MESPTRPWSGLNCFETTPSIQVSIDWSERWPSVLLVVGLIPDLLDRGCRVEHIKKTMEACDCMHAADPPLRGNLANGTNISFIT